MPQYKTVAGPVGLTIERKDSYENAVKKYAAIIDDYETGWIFMNITALLPTVAKE